jgi:OOP family OmpA-OmpF porin
MLNAQRFFNRGLALAIAAFALGACASTSSLDDLANTTPSGSPFTQQLFKNYAYLANSFGGGADADTDGVSSMFDDGTNSDLAEAFATKALIAARGTEPAPEPSTDDASSQARSRLMAALAQGKDHFPVDAARAQTDYDCWMLNATVESQAAAAASCRDSFGQSIGRLEADLHPAPPPPPPAPAPAAAANYTVYFDFDSWTLSGEQLAVLQSAINAARTGQQTHITIVGHTDTSGSADYNQGLSVKRANVVKDVLVQMGARPDSIQTSGVGETDLAVPTKDGVRERQNRRSVVTLLP